MKEISEKDLMRVAIPWKTRMYDGLIQYIVLLEFVIERYMGCFVVQH